MSTAATKTETAPNSAPERYVPLPLRSDTFLGVFQAIGEDLGFNPNWLRVPFAALILWNPTAIIACYLGLGCVVAVARWLFPAERKATVETAPVAAPAAEPAKAEAREEDQLLAA